MLLFGRWKIVEILNDSSADKFEKLNNFPDVTLIEPLNLLYGVQASRRDAMTKLNGTKKYLFLNYDEKMAKKKRIRAETEKCIPEQKKENIKKKNEMLLWLSDAD